MKIAVLIRGRKFEDFKFQTKFPGETEYVVPIGSRITPGTVIASGSSYQIIGEIDLISKFGSITLDDVNKGLNVMEGQVVDEETIVFSRNKFGVGTEKIYPPVSGMISLREIDRGIISILGTRSDLTVKSGLKGEVSGVFPDGTVEITSDAYALELFRVFGRNVSGTLEIVNKEDFIESNEEYKCSKDLKYKIALLRFVPDSVIYKALVVAGAVGIIVPSLSSDFFSTISVYKKITIGIIEGWGRLKTPKSIEDFISRLEGIFVEIVGGGSKKYFGRLVSSFVPKLSMEKTLREEAQIGTYVQINEPPYWAKEGEITDILEDKGVLVVSLESGESVVLPPESVCAVRV